jgi:hypothetical protein
MRIKILTTSIVAMFIFTLASISFAQNADGKMKDMKNMKMGDNPEMSEMMKSAHHKMMMAHRQNVLTFATTLRDLAKDSENFDADAAKTMVGEIKRSSEMMDKVHQDHMSKMKAEKKMNAEKMEKMAPMMEKMKKQKAELNEHIKALEKSVEADSIDRQEVEKHSSAIVEMLEGMKMGDQHKERMKMDMKDM